MWENLFFRKQRNLADVKEQQQQQKYSFNEVNTYSAYCLWDTEDTNLKHISFLSGTCSPMQIKQPVLKIFITEKELKVSSLMTVPSFS